MKIQNNIEIEDLELDIVSQYSYEITFTKKFKELFKNPIERKFAVEEILEFLLDNKMIAIDEEFLLLIDCKALQIWIIIRLWVKSNTNRP